MYRAKSRGGARVETLTSPLGRQAAHQQQLEAELRRALPSGQLRIAFQPYYSLASGAVVGYEALVRWNHPRRGLLAPASFLPLAEDTGLIEAIDRWVLAEACRHARRWASPLTVSVNTSPARCNASDLPEHVTATLATTGLDPRRLILELSERILFDDEPDALNALSELATAGVGIALDDFGAGYTSLNHLRLLPLTQLKIDRSLLAVADTQDEGSTIIAAVINFAHTLGLSVTAEGIERPPQLTFLSSLRCDYGQGFLLGRPAEAPQAK